MLLEGLVPTTHEVIAVEIQTIHDDAKEVGRPGGHQGHPPIGESRPAPLRRSLYPPPPELRRRMP